MVDDKQGGDSVKIDRLVLGMVSTNCYLISNEETKEAICFDPADNADRILEVLKEKDLTLKGILLTHGHFDHMSAAEELREKTKVLLYAMEEERQLLTSPEINLSFTFLGHPVIVNADEYLQDGQEITLASFKIKAIHTPGHTAGGCCYYFEKEGVLVSGDTLFCRTIGRTDFPTGSYSTLVDSIRNKLFALPDETIVLPGHEDDTTIGYEKKYNNEV